MRAHGGFLEFGRHEVTGTVRPTTTAYGTALVSGGSANSDGSYVELIQLTYDCYWFELDFMDNASNGTDRNGLVTVGMDYTGGTSYTDVISYLQVCAPANRSTSSTKGHWGVTYSFPYFIPAGTAIALKHRNNSVSSTVYANGRFWQNPRYPYMIPVGQNIVGFGVSASTSRGTAVTTSTGGIESSWVEIGTLDADYFYWQFGIGFNTIPVTVSDHYFDFALGDASNKRVIYKNVLVNLDGNTESCSINPVNPWMCFAKGKSGDKLYVRGTSSTSYEFTATAYGLR
jgi:hypothetical protein